MSPPVEQALGRPRYVSMMGILKKVAALGVAKKIYDEARKPENQAKMKQAVQKAKSRRNQGGAH